MSDLTILRLERQTFRFRDKLMSQTMYCKRSSLSKPVNFPLFFTLFKFLLRYAHAGTYKTPLTNTITIIATDVEAKAGSDKICLEAKTF